MFAGEIITCLENTENLQSVDLNELSVTLDIFVLTLPLEIEVMAPDFRHNRSVIVNCPRFRKNKQHRFSWSDYDCSLCM